jgi:hypothetical protein
LCAGFAHLRKCLCIIVPLLYGFFQWQKTMRQNSKTQLFATVFLRIAAHLLAAGKNFKK